MTRVLLGSALLALSLGCSSSANDASAPGGDTGPVGPPPIPGAVYGAKCADMNDNALKAWEDGRKGAGKTAVLHPVVPKSGTPLRFQHSTCSPQRTPVAKA